MRVIVTKDEDGTDKLGFEYPDGPVTPKPEKIPSRAKPSGSRQPRRAQAARPEGRRAAAPPAGRGSVPKVPLVKV